MIQNAKISCEDFYLLLFSDKTSDRIIEALKSN